MRWAPCGTTVAGTTNTVTEGTMLGQQTVANCKLGVDKWTNIQLTNGGGKVWVASSLIDACGTPAPASGTVLGNALKPIQMKWMSYIAKQVLPKLSTYYGDFNTALGNAAYVACWSVKGGVLEVDTPAFNLCDPGHKVLTNQWDGICAKESGFGTWQVGIAAIQSPITVDRANQMIPNLESISRKMGVEPANALRQIAVDSGFGNFKEAIASSRDRLRASWLLRVPYIAFVLQGPQVKSECFGASIKNWCFSSAWYPSKLFAPTAQSIPQAYNDVKNLLQKLR